MLALLKTILPGNERYVKHCPQKKIIYTKNKGFRKTGIALMSNGNTKQVANPNGQDFVGWVLAILTVVADEGDKL